MQHNDIYAPEMQHKKLIENWRLQTNEDGASVGHHCQVPGHRDLVLHAFFFFLEGGIRQPFDLLPNGYMHARSIC